MTQTGLRSLNRVLLIILSLTTLEVLASGVDWMTVKHPDQGDWSDKRKQSYEAFNTSAQPEAVLSIPSINVAAMVFHDDVPRALEGGLSRVSQTAEPGTHGNIAIAGHRDSFFRRLEGIARGTTITLGTRTHEYTFEVTEVYIVDALDISPLDETEHDTLTLITCYPFYYKGYAPDRYIVRGNLIETQSHVSTELAQSIEPATSGLTINID